jgi:hypothetical protein
MQPARWNDVADLQCDIPTKPICSGYLNFKVHVAANYFIQLCRHALAARLTSSGGVGGVCYGSEAEELTASTTQGQD